MGKYDRQRKQALAQIRKKGFKILLRKKGARSGTRPWDPTFGAAGFHQMDAVEIFQRVRDASGSAIQEMLHILLIPAGPTVPEEDDRIMFIPTEGDNLSIYESGIYVDGIYVSGGVSGGDMTEADFVNWFEITTVRPLQPGGPTEPIMYELVLNR